MSPTRADICHRLSMTIASVDTNVVCTRLALVARNKQSEPVDSFVVNRS
jgi:hypothetical protein